MANEMAKKKENKEQSETNLVDSSDVMLLHLLVEIFSDFLFNPTCTWRVQFDKN